MSIIYTSHINPSLLFHPLIRMGFKLKIHTNWNPTSNSTDSLIWSNTSNYSLISPVDKHIIYTFNTNYYTRTHMTNFPILTPSHNMIYFHSSRNQLSPIWFNRRRIRTRIWLQCKTCSTPFTRLFLAEYANIIIINIFITILFPGAFHNPYLPYQYTADFIIKTLLLTIAFLWIQASYPWFWYDQLIHLMKNFSTTNTSPMYTTCFTTYHHIKHPTTNIRNLSVGLPWRSSG